MNWLLVAVLASGCVDPRALPTQDADIDGPVADVVAPFDGPFYESRPTTKVIVGQTRVAWSQGTQACPLESGSGCPEPGPSISVAELVAGGAANLVLTRNGVGFLAGDQDELFYVNSDEGYVVARLRPGTPPVTMAMPAFGVIGPIADATYVYWFEGAINGMPQLIRRALRTAGNNSATTIASGGHTPTSMYVTAGYLWWVSCGSNCEIYRVPVAGGTIELVSVGLYPLASTADAILTYERISQTTYESRIVALRDDGQRQVLVDTLPVLAYPQHLVVHGSELFCALSNGEIYKAPITGGAPTFVASPPSIDGQRIFAVTQNSILFDFTRNGFKSIPR